MLSFLATMLSFLASPRVITPATFGGARIGALVVAVLGRREAAQSLGFAAAAASVLSHEQLSPAIAAQIKTEGRYLTGGAPEPWWTSEFQRLGGLFFDPAYAARQPPSKDCGYTFCSWAGVRFVSDAIGTTSSSTVTIIGSDDGESFWTVKGRFLNATSPEFRVDFRAKGGPPSAALVGTVHARSITWQDGSSWRRVSTAPPAAALTVRPKASSGVEGPFNDFKLPFNGTALPYVGAWIAPPPWPGSNLRIFSDRVGTKPSEEITVVGCDTPGEGCGLWFMLNGRWLDRAAGRLTVDFSMKGGPADLRGVFDGAGNVRWDDGNLYSRLEF